MKDRHERVVGSNSYAFFENPLAKAAVQADPVFPKEKMVPWNPSRAVKCKAVRSQKGNSGLYLSLMWLGLKNVLDGIRSSLRTTTKDFTAKGVRKDPEFLGAFLIDQMLGNRFGVDTAELAKDTRADLRDHVELWARIYLGWTFRTLVAARYGSDFAHSMTSEIRRLLERLQEIEPQRGELAAELDFWFTTLDNAATQLGTKIMGIEVPLEFFAALAFLGLDGRSPYYQNRAVADETELVLDVAKVLEMARIAAQERLRAWVEIGGPLPPTG